MTSNPLHLNSVAHTYADRETRFAKPIRLVGLPPLGYTQLQTYYDAKHQVAWYYMEGQPRPCFTPTLLAELDRWYDEVAERAIPEAAEPVRYLVAASKVPGVFNLGGDLDLFQRLIRQRDRQGLRGYAGACIEPLYRNMVSLERDLTTISLVQGDALGGGFEAALSSNVVIAERSARLGLPEVLFNLFPGMGAYSFLSRRVGPVLAERIILSGRLYNAEELHAMGVIDVVADDGDGEMAVYRYIEHERRAQNAYRAIRAVRQVVSPVTREELSRVTEIWVDAALRLEDRDLRKMDRLVARQNHKAVSAS
jgi:DSF synthase